MSIQIQVRIITYTYFNLSKNSERQILDRFLADVRKPRKSASTDGECTVFTIIEATIDNSVYTKNDVEQNTMRATKIKTIARNHLRSYVELQPEGV